MKRFSLALLVLPALLAFTPTASADTFTFSFIGVGNTIVVTGIFEATEIDSSGVYNIIGIKDGQFTDKNNGLDIVDAPISLIPDAGYLTYISTVDGAGMDYNSPDQTEYYDNELYFPGTPYNLDDWGGFLFSADGYEVSIAQDIGLTTYGAWVSVLGENADSNSAYWADTGSNISYGEPLNGDVQKTPELPSLPMLATGLLSLAFIVYRKAGTPAPALNS
ncbi:MAG: hypothetical protein ABSC77_14475 [Terracidiphilus sp.]|jgi:hypothetical protein